MNCPKCNKELKVEKTMADEDYIDLNIVCTDNDEHRFFTRIREDDLIDEE